MRIDAGMPRTIRVLGQAYEVTPVKNLQVGTGQVAASDLHEDYIHEEMMDVLGATDRDRLTIRLETDTGWDRFRETFLHEVLHTVVSKANLNHDHLYGAIEESVVARLAPILLQFLRDNPRAVEFLTASARP